MYLWVKCQVQFRSTNGPRLNDDPARANHQLISHAWNLKPGSVPAFKVLTYLRTLRVEDHENFHRLIANSLCICPPDRICANFRLADEHCSNYVLMRLTHLIED